MNQNTPRVFLSYLLPEDASPRIEPQSRFSYNKKHYEPYPRLHATVQYFAYVPIFPPMQIYNQPRARILNLPCLLSYLHVVLRGMDNGIYHKKFALPDGPWDTSWTNVGGATLSTLALAPVPGCSIFV